jgi:hypothetical protein
MVSAAVGKAAAQLGVPVGDHAGQVVGNVANKTLALLEPGAGGDAFADVAHGRLQDALAAGVEADEHDIGMKLFADMLQALGQDHRADADHACVAAIHRMVADDPVLFHAWFLRHLAMPCHRSQGQAGVAHLAIRFFILEAERA